MESGCGGAAAYGTEGGWPGGETKAAPLLRWRGGWLLGNCYSLFAKDDVDNFVHIGDIDSIVFVYVASQVAVH